MRKKYASSYTKKKKQPALIHGTVICTYLPATYITICLSVCFPDVTTHCGCIFTAR